MKFDYNKLRGRIREVLGTEGAFAEKLDRSRNYVSNCLNGFSFFTQTDIKKAAEILGIGKESVGEYFFTPKVHDSELPTRHE